MDEDDLEDLGRRY